MGLLWILLLRPTGAQLCHVSEECNIASSSGMWDSDCPLLLSLCSEVEKEKSVAITVEEPRAKRMKMSENNEQEMVTQKRVGLHGCVCVCGRGGGM